jgi:PAS domain S-box-containing protein
LTVTDRHGENRKRILIIDDSEGTTRSLTLIFRKKGYDTEAVPTGREGLERARRRSFNVILLDIRLPDVEGVDLLPLLRQASPETAIILITAFASEETAVTALNRGARLYFTKPLNVDVVLTRIDEIIGEQREAEEKRRSLEILGESAEQFRLLAEVSTDLIFQVDAEGAVVYASPAVEPMTGFPPGELIGRPFTACVDAADLDRAKEITRRNLAGERPGLMELRLRRRNWGTVPVELSTAPITKEDRIIGFQGIARDITSRRRAQETIRRTESRLQHLLLSSPVVIYSCKVRPGQSHDGDFRPTFVSGNLTRMLGYEVEECIRDPAWWTEHLHPDDAARAREEMADLFRDDRLTHEYRFRHRDGHYVWISDEIVLIRDPAGEPVEFIGSWVDITDRRTAEEAIRQSGERYRALFHESPISLWEEDFSEVKRFFEVLREKGVTDFRRHFTMHPEDVARCAAWIRVVDVNDATLQMFGADARDELMRGLSQVFTESSYDGFREELIAFAEGRTSCDVETRVRTLKGEEIAIFLRASVGPGQVETLSRVLVSIIDITEWKRTEVALRASEKKYRDLVDNAVTAVFQTNLQGDLLFANERTVRVMGYDSEEEMKRLGVRPLYRNPKDRDELIRRLKKEGRVDSCTLEVVTKSGESRSVNVYMTLQGDVISGIAVDVTERVLVEQELRRSQERLRTLSSHMEKIREEERRELALEVHDELGQALTALKLDLAWLNRQLPEAPREVSGKIAAMEAFVEQNIERVKRISSRLRPRLLDDLGLLSAIEWQAGEFEEKTGVSCRVVLPSGELDLDPERATALFRIFQETLTNITRHAKATRVRVLMSREPDHLLLRVSDNGVGIDRDAIDDPDSLGLLGMRERAYPWGGEVSIRGRPGWGTTVTVTLPWKGREER